MNSALISRSMKKALPQSKKSRSVRIANRQPVKTESQRIFFSANFANLRPSGAPASRYAE
jgi:hypothetical protein